MEGFTFIEALMVVAVFALLMGAVGGLVLSSYKSYRHMWDQITAVSEARRGVREMVKEIREASMGEDGSYPIAKAEDKEFIFYGDVDYDGDVERVRYFLDSDESSSKAKSCVSYSTGGECTVTFSEFLIGELTSAEVLVSAEGDLGWSREYGDVYVDGYHLGTICKNHCSDCAGSWEGNSTFDVAEYAEDGTVELRIDSTGWVDPFCDWEEPDHSVKANFKLTWTEDVPVGEGEFKKGITDPTGHPSKYDTDNEKVYTLSRYVRNSPPIFEYFDKDGNKIMDYPARLKDTKVMKVFLRVDVHLDRDPAPFDLISRVHLRNLESIHDDLQLE